MLRNGMGFASLRRRPNPGTASTAEDLMLPNENEREVDAALLGEFVARAPAQRAEGSSEQGDAA